jgi:hypothetical protein
MEETQYVFSACGLPGSVAEEFTSQRVDGEYEWVGIEGYGEPWYMPVGKPSLIIETLEVASQGSISWNFAYHWTNSEGTTCEVYTARIGWCMLYEISPIG